MIALCLMIATKYIVGFGATHGVLLHLILLTIWSIIVFQEVLISNT